MTTTHKKLITHNGSFHADDIFAAAILILYLEKEDGKFSAQGGPASGWEIIRTRDEEVIKTGDFVFDVGGIYDAEKNRFDHHQIGGAGRRVVGSIQIEYAAVGLVWKKFGNQICENQKVADLVEKRLIAPIDAGDNGFDLIQNLYEVSPYLLQHLFLAMRPTWREEGLKEDEMFLKSLEIAKQILKREIVQAEDSVLAEDLVTSAYHNSLDKRIIVLEKNYPYEYTLNNFSEPLFVIYFKTSSDHWMVKGVREDPKTFINRKNFPKLWAGLRDEELQNVSGVRDAVFCHRGLFLAVAKTKEGAIKLAQIAVES